MAGLTAALIVALAAAVAAPGALGAARVGHLPGPRIALPDGGAVDGLAVAPDGTLYAGLTRGGGASIAALDRDGRLLREWPFDALTTTRGPLVVAVGPDGHVYAAQHVDFAAGVEAVRVFRPDGTPVRSFGEGSGLFQVTDIELDAAGNVYLTSRARPDRGLPDDHVARFDAAGNLTGRFVPDPGHPDAFANGLLGLAVGEDGTAWVATSRPQRSLVRIEPDGSVAPAFDRRSALPTGSNDLQDLDYAGGRLYFSGFMGNAPSNPVAMVVTDTAGVRLDVVAGQAYDLAVASGRVYLAGLRGEGATTAALGDGVGSFRSVRVTSGENRTSGGVLCPGGIAGTGPGGSVTVLGSSGCAVQFHNRSSPWPNDSCVAKAAYHAGRPIAAPAPVAGGGYSVRVGRLGSGSVHVEWECVLRNGSTETRVEFKGEIVLVDPSGAVVDARSGRPVRGAQVRLETAPARGARFGRPSLSGISPQENPQLTDSAGRFGWDVAPGLWRLRIRAFGYRPYTSPVYVIPPEVTGLSLRLRPHPAQQARLIDPVAGRVGAVRLGGAPRPAAGLRLRKRGPRVRQIVVTGRRFRTVTGIRVGSGEAAVQEAYPLPHRRLRAALRGSVHRYPVGRATIEVRRGKVTRIVLGR